ncbi:MAG: phage tail sheath family protein [Actinobacteria bacterium]|nr:phage tail sheath family protein [Actinomycetota bacterium]
MPAELTYPGVYIEELPSGVRTIVGVSTSTTAFVGRARKGPENEATVIHSFEDFNRVFGGLWDESRMSFAVRQYFLNGGSTAVIVRVTRGVPDLAAKATFELSGPAGDLTIEAADPGTWGDNLNIGVDHDTRDPATLFNLVIEDPAPAGSGDVEILRNLSVDPASSSFVTKVLEQRSKFVRVSGTVAPQMPDEAAPAPPTTSGADGGDIRDVDVVPPSGSTGIYALDRTDIFNLLCLPPLTTADDIDPTTYADAAAFCEERRAMLIVDPPSTSTDIAAAVADHDTLNLPNANAALFFPRLKMANPLKNNLIEEFVPCGAVAGVFARTDSQRGVWKAPAGQDAALSGVSEMSFNMTDAENGQLNPRGINALRMFPLIGPVVWGARTLAGADALASEWKYIPVRRLALYIEESLFRGTKWVVFEPNDAPLWAQIRLNVGAFMNNLFRQGAFAGTTPRDAYFVKCDSETTTQDDVNRGIVNIAVGFAPLKPAEFVVIQIQQMAGQTGGA